MTYTNVSLCSKALLKIGAQTITSFEDGTAEAEISGNLYPIIRDGLLSSYPWSFAVCQKRLARLDMTPLVDFAYAFQLPEDFLRVITAGSYGKGNGREYRILENRLYTNSPEIVLTYIYQVSEETFPTFFSEILVSKLAAEFCIPLTESSSRAEFLNKKFEDECKRARLIDSQQATPQKFEDFTLVGARQ